MKKTLLLLTLLMMLLPVSQVFAEDVPDGEAPEMFDSTPQAAVFDIGAVNLDDEPEPEPEPEPESDPAE